MNTNTKVKLIEESKKWDTRPIIHMGIRSCHREIGDAGVKYEKKFGLDTQVVDLKCRKVK